MKGRKVCIKVSVCIHPPFTIYALFWDGFMGAAGYYSLRNTFQLVLGDLETFLGEMGYKILQAGSGSPPRWTSPDGFLKEEVKEVTPPILSEAKLVTLWRKLIFVASIHDLILSFTTRSLWP